MDDSARLDAAHPAAVPLEAAHLDQLADDERARQAQYEQRIFCCTSTACLSAGAGQTRAALESALAAHAAAHNHDAQHAAEIVPTGCMGLCSRGPLVRVEARGADPVLYGDVTDPLARQIVAHHLAHHLAQHRGAAPPATPDPDDAPDHTTPAAPHDFPHLRAGRATADPAQMLAPHVIPLDLPFFARQVRVVLAGTGRINPEKLEDTLAHGGYQALRRVLSSLSPAQVCDEIQRSGLRGRGGAGFPTGTKWHYVRREAAPRKFVIVNGDEGDPGAYMDRTVMEDDPHRVLEGMIICAYAVGASYGYFYIRGEYPVAIERIRRAIRAARRRGLLGDSILGTDFSFDADIRIGAGAFVCGEETALIHSVEGQRGIPRIRPPYPSTAGLWGAPTVLNNVETMANIPAIITRGADWFAGIGTEHSKGTKVFALAGELRNTGLIEVPMGIPLRTIVEEIGGGVPGGGRFKAAQTGGPSGGCIPAEHLDAPVDYESLRDLGSIMGSGGLVVLDDKTQMPAFARFFMDFCVDESCGKCVACRVGTLQIRKLLDRLLAGDGVPDDLARLETLCRIVKTTSLCGLGQSAPNPVLSTLAYFRAEYEALLATEETHS